MKRIFCLLLVTLSIVHADESPLMPPKTDNPRDTMQTFMEAMQDYKETQDVSKLDRAARCLNLENLDFVSAQIEGRAAAIYLKETIDRVIVVNYKLIPESSENPEHPLLRWRLKDTEIVIAQVQEGDRVGEYLFSPATVARAHYFFDKVKHLPYVKGSGGGAGYEDPWMDQTLPSWTRDDLFGMQIWQWLGLFLAILLGLTIRWIVRLVSQLIQRFTSKTSTDWDDKLVEAAGAPISLLVASVFWFACIYALRFKGAPLTVLSIVLQVLLFASLIWLVYRLVDVLSSYLQSIISRTNTSIDDQLINLLGRSLKVFVVIFGAMLAAQNLGIEVFSVLAGLGIGGLAVALAAKDSLANFFGSIMIMFDRPFKVGHWVIVDGAEGTVEEIGFRSTRIRTFYDSVISIPNSEIAVAQVDNLGLREYRRIKTFIGVTYDTPPDKLEAFVEGIKNIILANPNTRKDYFHVVFSGFGDSSLNIMLYLFLKVENWSAELVEKQNLFLEIVRLADQLGVDFAFPTQSLHIETFPEKQKVRQPHERDHEKMASLAKGFAPEGTQSKPSGSGLFVPPYHSPTSKHYIGTVSKNDGGEGE